MLLEMYWAFLWHFHCAVFVATGSDRANVKMSNAGNNFMRLLRLKSEHETDPA